VAERPPLHDAHASAGAAFAETAGWLLPSWYGDPGGVAAEYAAARDGAALVDLPERGILEASGPQRQKFLQGMLSNDVLDRAPGEGCLAAFMTGKGHLLAFLRALVTKDAVLLEMPAERLDGAERALLHYRVAAPVRFRRLPTAVLGLLGPGAGAVLGAAGCAIGELAAEAHREASVAGHAVRVARAGDLPGAGYAIHVGPQGADAVWSALRAAGARPLGRAALDALRVEEGCVWFGPDATEDNLLHETGLVRLYHSPTKGCYVGQEVIARLEARGGHVSRQLRGLRLEAPAPPGSAVSAEGKEVGRVTTSAVSPRLGPIAMAYVHRGHFEPGTVVEVAGSPATVTGLPLEG
jgi:folate-binding protein YgfZ